MPERLEMTAIVKGHVQGVGFRAMVLWLANQLHLKGTVRNLPDGTVEIIAQGTQNHLNQLLNDLRSNRGRGVVEEVVVSYATPQQLHNTFTVTK